MKILVIEKEIPGVDWSRLNKELLTRESVEVYKLYLSGELREHYFNEHNRAVLIMECRDKAHATELVRKLPLVEQKLISFEIMELQPYNGYERILHYNQSAKE